MSCHELREDLIGLLYDELDETARRRVEDHLRTCQACRTDRETLGETSGRLQAGAGRPASPPAGLFAPVPRRSSPWLRAAAVAAVAVTACLLGLSIANADLRHTDAGWTARFSLLPRLEPAPADAALIEESVAELVRRRMAEERRLLFADVDRRLESERQRTIEDLSRALEHQEEVLNAGLRSEKEELLRRDRMFEEMLGSEITRTRQMLGAVLAASEPQLVAR